MRKLAKSDDGPSIREILAGKPTENNLTLKEQHEIYTSNHLSEEFTSEEFHKKWAEFLLTVDSPNLKITLSSAPDFSPDFRFILKIENTVQEELLRTIKPELVTFLRKELKNTSIEVVTEIVEKKGVKMVYSDDEKYAEMAKKNPDILLLRQKFNLDFGD